MIKIILLTLLILPVTTFSQTMSVKVYFSSEKFNPGSLDCSKVFPVTRKIPKTKSVAKAALEELFKGVTKTEAANGYYSFFSDATKSILISVKVKKGMAYVNLKHEVIEKLGNATTTCGGGAFDAQLEKTLKQFPSIKKIFFAIEGNPEDYYEWMQIVDCPKELKNCSGKDF